MVAGFDERKKLPSKGSYGTIDGNHCDRLDGSEQKNGRSASLIQFEPGCTPAREQVGSNGDIHFTCDHHDNSNGAKKVKQTGGRRSALLGGYFRYLVAALVISGYALHVYANYTFYIVAIEMISSDVLSNGLTKLRVKHMALDPFLTGSNAAAIGTCPVPAQLATEGWQDTVNSWLQPISSQVGVQLSLQNATQLSEQQQILMAVDTVALVLDVESRVAGGQLVNWTINERGLAFTAHTVGGLLFSVPMSRLGLRYGSKHIISTGLIASTLKTLLLPLVAGRAPFWFVLVFEFVLGALAYGTICVLYPIAASWLLPAEASTFIAIFALAGTIGSELTNFISTQMLAQSIDWSWCFYLAGGTLALISLAWLVLGADRPELSRFISDQERQLLAQHSVVNSSKLKEEELLGALLAGPPGEDCYCSGNQSNSCPARQFERKPNWSTIIACPTIWALILINFAGHWNIKVATLWPTYFANQLHLSASAIGILLGFKGLISLLYGSLFAFLTRRLAIRRPFNMSLTVYRKLCQLLSLISLTLSVALMSIFDCDLVSNIISVLMTILVTNFNVISFAQIPLDVSPEDSGLIASYVRLLSIGDIVALPTVSYVLSFAPSGSGDRLTWRLVWIIGLLVKLVACLVFLTFVSAEPKSYARVKPKGSCKRFSA